MKTLLTHIGWLLFALMVRLPLIGTCLLVWAMTQPVIHHALKTSVLIVPSTLLIFVMLVCSLSLIFLEPKRGTSHATYKS